MSVSLEPQFLNVPPLVSRTQRCWAFERAERPSSAEVLQVRALLAAAWTRANPRAPVASHARCPNTPTCGAAQHTGVQRGHSDELLLRTD